MPVHAVARSGFSQVSAAYERGRPAYPPECLQHLRGALGLRHGSRVLELGAGTGKFTRALASAVIDPLALEPLPAMRALLRDSQPEVPLLGGVAEAIPLRDGSLDAVVAAQAFHWFRPEPTVRELARVLRDGGGVGLLWNIRDETVPWQRELSRRLEPYRPAGVPSVKEHAWQEAFRHTPDFDPLSVRSFPSEQSGDVEMFVDRIRSVSFVAILPSAPREALLTEMKELAARAAASEPSGRVVIRYRTEVFSTRRHPR